MPSAHYTGHSSRLLLFELLVLWHIVNAEFSPQPGIMKKMAPVEIVTSVSLKLV